MRVRMLAAAAALFSLSCSAKKDVLYLFNWTYYTPDSVIAKFEDEYGVRVKIDSYASNEEMFAKLMGGATGYDVVVPSQDYAQIMLKLGMLAKIDKTRLSNAGNVNPAVLEKAGYDREMDYCVPYFFGLTGVMVNKTKASDYPRDYSIFADPRFRGKVCLCDDKREILGGALKSLGHSVNAAGDAQLAEAEALIREKWLPNVGKFDAESYGKSFASGDFWVAQGYCEVVFGEYPEERWGDIDFFIPECGGPAYLDSMCVLKDAKHYDLALKFIDFILRPEIYAEFLDEFRFPATVVPAAEKFTKFPPHYGADMLERGELKNDLAEDLAKYDEIWERIRY